MAKQKKPSSLSVATASVGKDSALPESRPRNFVDERMLAIDQSHKTVKRPTLLVDPEECRLWERHDRDYDRLDEQACKDLIDSFIAEGKQQYPAVVRRLKGEDKKYEIITGARRFWTVNWLRENNYPSFKFLIEVRELTDEEAFRLSDLENLDRKDISDYERAKKYYKALHVYKYYSSQTDMAKRLNKSKTFVSRHLRLAQLPIQIPNAYASWSDLKIHHAEPLLKLLESSETKDRLVTRATELHAEHSQREADGKPPLTGPDVLKRLKAVGERPKKSRRGGPVASYGPKDSPHLTLKNINRHSLNFQVSRSTGADIDAIVDSFREALEKHYAS